MPILHNGGLSSAQSRNHAIQNGVLDAVTSEKIVQAALSVIVTEDCVVIPSFSGQPHTVLSLASIFKIKIVKTFHPSLLVIAVGLFLLSAAALSSKDGAGTGIPMGVMALGFLVAFLASQRARVVFLSGAEATQSISGSFSEVADLISAVEISRRNLLMMTSEKLLRPSFLTRCKQWLAGRMSPQIRTITL